MTLAVGLGLLPGIASAQYDDKSLLRSVTAPPNILVILDSSTSMTWPPETVLEPIVQPDGTIRYQPADGAMLPGNGDDPRSRMGIAKEVLLENLDLHDTEGNPIQANWALAQYTLGYNSIDRKHWVAESLGQDRFHIIDPHYGFRIGINSQPGPPLIDPADIAPDVMIGMRQYYDPAGSAKDRYGPIDAEDLGFPNIQDKLRFDLLPIYFGQSTDTYKFPANRYIQSFRRCTTPGPQCDGT